MKQSQPPLLITRATSVVGIGFAQQATVTAAPDPLEDDPLKEESDDPESDEAEPDEPEEGDDTEFEEPEDTEPDDAEPELDASDELTLDDDGSELGSELAADEGSELESELTPDDGFDDTSEEMSDERSEDRSDETSDESLDETSVLGGDESDGGPLSVTLMESPPKSETSTGISQRSSWGGSGHKSRGSSGPSSNRSRGAWSNCTRMVSTGRQSELAAVAGKQPHTSVPWAGNRGEVGDLNEIACGRVGIGAEELAGEGARVCLRADPGNPQANAPFAVRVATGRLHVVAAPAVDAAGDFTRVVAGGRRCSRR